MTTNPLAKHYHALSPAERLALMLAAAARGDDVEHARLVDAAPRVNWRVPHTLGRVLAFLGVFCQHRMERLELAALLSQAATLADEKTDALGARLREVVRLYGYLANVHAEAWATFCAAEGLDPAVCDQFAPGAAALELAASAAVAVAFTAAEAREYARRGGEGAQANLKTVESVAAELREAYQFLVMQWE